MKHLYQNDMSIHTQHWGRSMSNWDNAINIVEDYLSHRPDFVLMHIQDFFGLQAPVPVSIRAEPPGAGTISFSGLGIGSKTLKGKFFPGMSYELQTSSIPGFSLDHWQPFESAESSIDFTLTDTMEIVAYFLPDDHSFPIQICEVYSNNRDAYDTGDWIEFYYYGSDSLNLEGWTITGDQNQVLYTFGQNSIIKPGQRFLVLEDSAQFTEVFLSPITYFGDMKQGFSNNSILTMKSGNGDSKKTVALMSSTEWPALPEEGFSLELKSIVDDTGDGASWELSENRFGSPGLPNSSCYTFHLPSGKDTVFTSFETRLLEFSSSEDYYQDLDHHKMAGISIKELVGPGHIFQGETRIEQGKIYDPSDLVFSPQEPFNSASSLVYSFIDKSGQESSNHMIQFNPALNLRQDIRPHFRLYPVPAGDFCTIEIPSTHQGSIDFLLFDLNGKRC